MTTKPNTSASSAKGSSSKAKERRRVKENQAADLPRTSARVSRKPFPIVGVGASAGGLEAFRELLKNLPSNSGMAFVLVQHLAPSYESELTKLLAPLTKMPTQEVTNQLRVQPDHVYVIPPNTHMAIENGVLKLSRGRSGFGAARSIDFFFESLAQDQHEFGIGVILSGTASDGTLGLEAIKAEGGITFAQDHTAKFDSMPQNAIAAGCVDLVLSPEGIARELAQIANHPYVVGQRLMPLEQESAVLQAAEEKKTTEQEAGGSPDFYARPKSKEIRPYKPESGAAMKEDDPFKGILLQLRNYSGVDFSLYKTSTIRRRINRRMVLNRLANLENYTSFLKGNTKELEALYADVLINVTSFFRNPEAFEVLKRKVIPKLLENRRDEPMRIWSVGCSTGQEAYSLAMVLEESLENIHRKPKVQIFATDLNDVMLEKARLGLYAKSVVENVSPERIRRFFIEEEGGYRISKTLRDMVVFAKQNVLSDPPFSKMDLISCRNVLIYMEGNLQKKIIPSFHYALKPRGFLMLGGSESIGSYQDYFDAVDKKQKIYVKKPAPNPVNLHIVPGHPSEKKEIAAPKKQPLSEVFHTEINVQREADRVAINRYVPPSVLVNADLQVWHFRGDTSPYLKPPVGKPRFHLLQMAREGLILPLRASITKAKRENRTIRLEKLKVKQNGQTRTVNIEVIPLKNLKETCFLVFFEDCQLVKSREILPPASPLPTHKESEASKERRQRVLELEQELAETRDYLQSIQEQYEAANEELQASNEEVTSANEELQSINEELETSKEELESTNEELTTVNEEMANRNFELGRLNSDLNNLYANVNMAIVLLGRDLAIRRFTAPAEKVFSLLATDVGRPITRIKTNLEIDLGAFLSEVIDTVTARECEARGSDGRWYALRARPYLTLDNKIDGAVLVVVDIDAIKRSEQESRHAREYSETILRSAPVPLLVLQADLAVELANEAFYKTFKTVPEETIGFKIYELGNGQWNIPKLRLFLEEIIPRNSFFTDFEVTHDFAIIGRRTMFLTARRLVMEPVKRNTILVTIEDLTRRLEAEAAVRRSELRFRRLFETAQDGILVIDSVSRKVNDCNPLVRELLGLAREEVLGKELWQLGLIKDEPTSHSVFRDLQQKGVVSLKDVVIKTRRGEERVLDLVANRYKEDEGEVIQCNIRDITERKQSELQLTKTKEELERVNDTLEQRVSERTGALEILNARLQDLSGRLISAQEEERRRISRELHDEVAQSLTALKIKIQQLGEKSSPGTLNEMDAIADDLMTRIQRLSLELHPHLLEQLGLKSALESHFRNYENQTNIHVNFKYEELPRHTRSPQVDINLYRVVQEALTNIARHSKASEASVRLYPKGNSIHLEIHDSGKGFDPASRKIGSVGLSGMEERASLLKGTFRIESAPGKGTHIFMSVPFSREETAPSK